MITSKSILLGETDSCFDRDTSMQQVTLDKNHEKYRD
jgi:hypothetical protein